MSRRRAARETADDDVDGRGVYSFCMCPGGFVVPATTAPDRVVVNGMSLSRRDSPYANSGVVVAIEPQDWCADGGAEWGWSEALGGALASQPWLVICGAVASYRTST